MLAFLTIFHILVALVLIALVLVQDSKGGGALGIGGGSNSFLGATGAQTLAATLTKWTAVLFAISCLALAALIGSKPKSVIDNLNLPPATSAVPTDTTAPANSVPTPENSTSQGESAAVPSSAAPSQQNGTSAAPNADGAAPQTTEKK